MQKIDKKGFVSQVFLPELALWEKKRQKSGLASFDLEITARCNNDCRHCYINLPADDKQAKKKELPLKDIEDIALQAADLGAVWCLVTGGEPLLRDDFYDIFLCLKKRGLLVSVFTNATLITKHHADFFKRYPPRDIEVTVYGATRETYERVTRQEGSFAKFMRGLNFLLSSGVKVRLKAMALRSNLREFPEISAFCRRLTKDYFRYDPMLHLRFDRNRGKNRLIRSERLDPSEIAALEQADPRRSEALKRHCDRLITSGRGLDPTRLFYCGTGRGIFSVSYDGLFRPCSSLWQKDCVYNLKKGGLQEAYTKFAPEVRAMRSHRKNFLGTCGTCTIKNLCLWCPAHADLETGRMDARIKYFCDVAHARALGLRGTAPSKDNA